MRLSDKVMTDSTVGRQSTDKMMDKCCVGTAKLTINGQSNRVSDLKVKRAVLKVTGLRRSVTNNNVRQFFANYAPVRYVGRRPDGHYLIRFDCEADNVLAIIDCSTQVVDESTVHNLIFNGQEVSAQVLTGNEEDSFWTTSAQCSQRKADKLQHRRNKFGKRLVRKRADSQSDSGGIVSIKRLAQEIV